MPSFTYNPGPEDPEFIRTQNRTFKAGESFDLADDDRLVQKFRGHPQFKEEGAETPQEQVNEQQAQLNADARQSITKGRRETVKKRDEARQALAQAEAEERRLAGSERALGTLSPAEIRAMEHIRGMAGDDGDPVPGEAGYGGDGVSGGGTVGRQSGMGTAGGLEPDNKAKAEDRPQQ